MNQPTQLLKRQRLISKELKNIHKKAKNRCYLSELTGSLSSINKEIRTYRVMLASKNKFQIRFYKTLERILSKKRTFWDDVFAIESKYIDADLPYQLEDARHAFAKRKEQPEGKLPQHLDKFIDSILAPEGCRHTPTKAAIKITTRYYENNYKMDELPLDNRISLLIGRCVIDSKPKEETVKDIAQAYNNFQATYGKRVFPAYQKPYTYISRFGTQLLEVIEEFEFVPYKKLRIGIPPKKNIAGRAEESEEKKEELKKLALLFAETVNNNYHKAVGYTAVAFWESQKKDSDSSEVRKYLLKSIDIFRINAVGAANQDTVTTDKNIKNLWIIAAKGHIPEELEENAVELNKETNRYFDGKYFDQFESPYCYSDTKKLWRSLKENLSLPIQASGSMGI